MKEKLKLVSKQIVSAEEDSKEILDIAQKRGIKIPSSHLGFFKTIYAKIEEPNLNGIRLAEDAVREAVPGLVGSQVNFEHLGAGFLMGNILDAWINAEDQIEVVYSFFKSIYPDEYEESVELAKSGELSVSFELLSERESQEHLADGTIRLHDIDFQGMGHLMDNPPAYPEAKVQEFATKCKERLSHIKERDLVCASQIEETCNQILNADKWSSDIWNKFPNSSFAVVEPAFADGITGDKKARHLPFKDRDGKFDLTNYRIALDKVDTILPITDSITTEELRKKAKEELDKHIDISQEAKEKDSTKPQGGVKSMTEEQKKLVEELRAELGDFAKDIKDEDLLDESVVAEIRKEKEVEETKAKEELAFKIDSVEIRTFSLEEKDGVETVVENVQIVTTRDFSAMQEAQARVEELEKSLEAKDSEVDAVRENAETIGKRKVELKDNEFAKDFTDEDYLDEEKVEKATQDQKNSEIVETRKEELKENEYAKDFEDSDYLNDDKVELAKVKKEKDELEAKKDKIDASEDKTDDEDMSTGDNDNEEDGKSYSEVMASIREDKKKQRKPQKIYERK